MSTVHSQRPSITVSTLDLERLEALMAQAPRAALPYVEALETELARASVVEPEQIPADVATMNSVVRYRDLATQQEHRATLVYPQHLASTQSGISVLAPVGSALLGLRVGQSIHWQVPGGHLIELELLGIDYQPEAAGEYHR
ncbi:MULTISPECIES: nucleoside diphosphate kinase regulator [Pandoraea]|uniref:Elongation factor GreAB n=1 Tax=Pandoraea communis TaxID=2508297 RepID=A0A5E4YZC6_9BURK|nr:MULTISPECIES: nucleoside diphosphate kinase regulator [Pandoraea]EON15047.1 nucleoside diphosphate kinase regulator [Pandoraea sp. SD6-2]MDM8358761.1 nucleoside diphosphate kinase regulator [Pandoraea communis]VVE32530.1 elongation factor GreAB [Pandoraea communis]VVE54196.1 elongation factor GreAB [Pandoraea communis]